MKSEHRHELAENDLSKILSRWLQKVEPHSNKILLAALILTVVVIAVVYGMKSATVNQSAGFADLAKAQTAAEFQNVADDYPDSLVGTWARLRSAEEFLDEGIRLSVSNRSGSNDSLENSREAFDKVLKTPDVPTEIREKALYGMGVCLESLSDGDTASAIEVYETLLREFPDTRYKFLAESRIAALKTSGAQQFYAWFREQNPKPEDRPKPRDFPSDLFGLNPPEEPQRGTSDDDASGLPPPPPSAENVLESPLPPSAAPAESGPALPNGASESAPSSSSSPASPAGDSPEAPTGESPSAPQPETGDAPQS
jgi:hypothetical protein